MFGTDTYTQRLRHALLRKENKSVLLAQMNGSVQSSDSYTELNCNGLGRIRVFRKYSMHLRSQSNEATRKPLLRGHPPTSELRTQVFQVAGCNWHCWYCYVDDALLNALPQRGCYLTADELLDLYLKIPNRPTIIDLSGGQPDIVPEWAYWVMEALERRDLMGKVFVWQDDNLSSDMMWRVLTSRQIAFMASFPNHSRVGCFKGFDQTSFAFNTAAHPKLFENQFHIFQMLLESGFDMYAYVTLTAPQNHVSKDRIARFVDRLQMVHPMLPLRTIPLRVRPFAVTAQRMAEKHEQAFQIQYNAIQLWEDELRMRFPPAALNLSYEAIDIRPHKLHNDSRSE